MDPVIAALPKPEAAPRPRTRRLQISLYAAIAFLFWTSLYLYVPTLPVYVAARTSGLAAVGAVLAMYGLWQAIVRLPMGIAADWLGWRKPFLVAGMALSALGALWLGRASGFGELAAARAVTGLAASSWVPMVVTFSALFRPEQAVLASGLLTTASSLGRVVASSLNGTLNTAGGPGLAFMGAAGVAALGGILLLPAHESRRAPQRPALSAIGRLVLRRDVLLPALLAAVSQYGAYATTFGFVPILARDLGASDVILSILAAVNLGLYTAGNLLATALAPRWPLRRLATIGFGLLAAGLILCAVGPTMPWLTAAQGMIGLATGMGYPVLMGASIRLVGGSERTTAMGLHQAVYAIGMFTGPWLSGLLAGAVGVRWMFTYTAVGILVLGILGSRSLVETK